MKKYGSIVSWEMTNATISIAFRRLNREHPRMKERISSLKPNYESRISVIPTLLTILILSSVLNCLLSQNTLLLHDGGTKSMVFEKGSSQLYLQRAFAIHPFKEIPANSNASSDISSATEAAIPTTAPIMSVTGAYQGDDGLLYLVRQSGDAVWMIGLDNETKNVDGLPSSLIMFIGTSDGNNIDGQWKELSIGPMDRSLPLAGTLSLRVERNPSGEILSMQKTAETGGFTTSSWTTWMLYCAPEECVE